MTTDADIAQLAADIERALQITGFSTRAELRECLRSDETNCLITLGLRRLSDAPSWWRSDLASRLADSYADPDATLGEIRAYGTLRSAGFIIEPVQTNPNAATPDFRVTARDGTYIYVEVATKNWDQKERQALCEFQSSSHKPESGQRIAFREHWSAPFGAPAVDPTTRLVKPGDSVTANVVQRLCGIKQDEAQFKEGDVNLLFLDLARGDPLPLMGLNSTFPLRSFNEHLTSGDLFAAFYGRHGMPIYNNRPLTYSSSGMTLMGHDGRFRQETKLSGVLVSCRSGLALLENPWCSAPLSCHARRQFLECFKAELQYFWACFVDARDLEARIAGGIALLEHFRDIDTDV